MILLPALVSATTYYVSTTGNDTNPGTQTQPWKTIQKAADTMVAGDTVKIQPGTYTMEVDFAPELRTSIRKSDLLPCEPVHISKSIVLN